ncbi:MAG: S41 family peptidase [Ignavibacteriales bacterium]|nr:S41 family peptidase [Ignavibacteriales bacterium]
MCQDGELDEARKLANLFVKAADAGRFEGRGGAKTPVSCPDEPALGAVPLVVWTGAGTAGPAELVAGLLQELRKIKIVGFETSGLVGRTTLFPLKDESAVLLTSDIYVLPSGRKLWDDGLTPDVAIPVDKLDEKTYLEKTAPSSPQALTDEEEAPAQRSPTLADLHPSRRRPDGVRSAFRPAPRLHRRAAGRAVLRLLLRRGPEGSGRRGGAAASNPGRRTEALPDGRAVGEARAGTGAATGRQDLRGGPRREPGRGRRLRGLRPPAQGAEGTPAVRGRDPGRSSTNRSGPPSRRPSRPRASASSTRRGRPARTRPRSSGRCAGRRSRTRPSRSSCRSNRPSSSPRRSRRPGRRRAARSP